MILRSMNLHAGGRSFNVGENEVNWKWILKGDGRNWLVENPDWERFKDDGKWDQIKEEERVFLDKYGFMDLFGEYGVTYFNVTEEVLSNVNRDLLSSEPSLRTTLKPEKKVQFLDCTTDFVRKIRLYNDTND